MLHFRGKQLRGSILIFKNRAFSGEVHYVSSRRTLLKQAKKRRYLPVAHVRVGLVYGSRPDGSNLVSCRLSSNKQQLLARLGFCEWLPAVISANNPLHIHREVPRKAVSFLTALPRFLLVGGNVTAVFLPLFRRT